MAGMLERTSGSAGLKLSRTKTKYMLPQEDSRKLRLRNYNQEDYAELPAVSDFKYLGNAVVVQR